MEDVERHSPSAFFIIMGNNSTLQNSSEVSQIVLYKPEETISIEVKLDAEHDTVWLSQAQMADLYGTQRQAITKHIKNIYNSYELQREETCSILELVQKLEIFFIFERYLHNSL